MRCSEQHRQYGNMGCQVSKRGIQMAKNLHIQRKSLFFENAIKDSLSKIEVTPKNYFNKNCAHIPLFWFEKKNQKDSEESRYWKLILKVRL